ncbi:MAG: restriction endonuclease [Rhodanobacter sp.]
MPWQMGIALGLIGYIAIRHGIGWYLASLNDPIWSAVGKSAASGVFAPFAWILLVSCWGAAIASFAGRIRRGKLLDSQTGIDSLRQMNWRQFEQLTGEAFRRQGYAITETGLGGADGGIDLILRKNGQTTLVQCKQWRTQQVGVNVVREMYGLLLHHQAAAVKIVALGNYTNDARRFIQGKPIELIEGRALIATVRSVQTTKARAIKPMDPVLALAGSMLASLFLIAVFWRATTRTPLPVGPPVIPPSVAIQTATSSTPRPIARSTAPPEAHRQAVNYRRGLPNVAPPPEAAPEPSVQATITKSDSQDDTQLREWKKQNAASMKILEKTTKEMPLR